MPSVIFQAGSLATAFVPSFITHVAGQLEALGIHSPPMLRFLSIPEAMTQELFFYSFSDSPSRFIADEEDVFSRLPRLEAGQTLLLSNYELRYTPKMFERARGALLAIHPEWRQKVFFPFCRSDLELEFRYCLSCYRTPGIILAPFVEQFLKQAPTIFDFVTKWKSFLGSDAVRFHAYDQTAPGRECIVRALLGFAGVSDKDADLLLAARQLSGPVLPPREFLEFCRVSVALAAPSKREGIAPWATQAHRLLPEAGYVAEGHSLLGPERRAEVLRHYASPDRKLAALLDSEQAFSEPDPEPDWRPFWGFTADLAFAVASRLDPEFARARRDEFDAIPAHCLNRDERLCRDALHDACDDAPAKPFFRPAAPAEPKLSVLTLTYNHAAYIAENIESVIAQNVSFPIQHIIADDCSDDGTRDIILRYAERYPHIVPVFQRKRSGGSKNVVALFSMARTEYAALCDGDDYFCDPQKLQKQVDFLDANPRYSICFHPVKMVWENKAQPDRIFPYGRELPPHRQPFTLTDLVRWNFMSTPSVLYRWRFRDGLPDWFNSRALPGDWYWHMLHAEQGRIGMLTDPMSVYRRNDGGVWRYAETDLVQHKKIYGLSELRTYIEIDRYFKGRFRNILSDTILWEFSMLYEMSVKHDTPELFEQAVKEFPEWAKELLGMLRKTSQGI